MNTRNTLVATAVLAVMLAGSLLAIPFRSGPTADAATLFYRQPDLALSHDGNPHIVDAIAAWAAATGGVVQDGGFSFDPDVTGSVDPDSPHRGVAALSYGGARANRILSCDVTVRDAADRSAWVHEIGHCLGISGHIEIDGSVMQTGSTTAAIHAVDVAAVLALYVDLDNRAYTPGLTAEFYQVDAGERCRVVKWADGDTLTVQCGTRRHVVRLEAVNAGDVYHGECMAAEARAYVRRTFPVGSTVVLSHTNGGAATDAHGRLLRIVTSRDGTNASLALIERGLAKFPRQAASHPAAGTYAAAEKAARKAGVGIWGDCGNRDRPWG